MATPTSSSTLKNSYRSLVYSTKDAKDVKLPGAAGDEPKWNVVDLVFDFRIRFSQRVTKDQSICSLTYSQNQYQVLGVFNAPNDQIELTLAIKGTPIVTFSGAQSDKALDLPLAKAYSSFESIKLYLPWDSFKPKPKSLSDCRLSLHHLITARISNNPATPEGEFCETMAKISTAESAAQAKLVGSEEGCRIKTSRWRNQVVVQAWPNMNAENADLDLGANQLGARYVIRDSTVFSEGNAKAHKYPSQEGARWELNVVNHLAGFEAPIVGLMANRFKKGEDIESFLGKQEAAVKLEPIFDDLLGMASRSALKDFGQKLDELNADVKGFITPSLTPEARLPMRAMWLKGMAYVDEDNRIMGDTPPAPQWRGNPSQREAVRKALTCKVSLIWGPAATGKSETMTQIILTGLRNDPTRRTLVVAPRNVPVDSLLARVGSEYKEAGPFVRLYSHHQTLVHYATKDKALENQYHIDNLRYAVARKQPTQWATYLTGREEEIREGFIADDKQAAAFHKAYTTLTRVVMNAARVVFCTPALCDNSALYWKEKSTDSKGDVKSVVMTWKPTSYIVDEAACANHLELLLPLGRFGTIRHVVWGGDHEQLGAFLVSDEARKAWKKSFFKDLMDRQWPLTQLNINYRTHSALAEAPNHVIYEGKVNAHYPTLDYPTKSGSFNSLVTKLPIAFSADDKQYELTTYVNIVNVAHGAEEGQFSKSNVAEVNCIVEMIKRFHVLGMPSSIIAVITAYVAQFELLLDRFRQLQEDDPNGKWDKINLLTAGRVQAEEYDVVILSLVKTKGSRGFIGEKSRANVVCTRAKVAMYYVGNWGFWQSENKTSFVWLDKILYRIRDTCGRRSLTGRRPAFAVNPIDLMPAASSPHAQDPLPPLPAASTTHAQDHSSQLPGSVPVSPQPEPASPVPTTSQLEARTAQVMTQRVENKQVREDKKRRIIDQAERQIRSLESTIALLKTTSEAEVRGIDEEDKREQEATEAELENLGF